jgi:uncharacterized C2H2 Zn-finger protein
MLIITLLENSLPLVHGSTKSEEFYQLWLNYVDDRQSSNRKLDEEDIISRCAICGNFFQSKKELKDHKDNKNHRITNSKTSALKGMIAIIAITD